ncbi:pyridoxal phosphatase [Erwinia tracheiphila]|uniref:Pyridoxal phosphatase n=1 Tax=Erwinia tracheiphila TaxID=65700 RepID=A0A0M2KDM8_9GAMM|nr:pyridoxal phosphatase [Erwinia tracheiphila]AXF76328.1 pyridoxal phosphatase [Erwinia tracheiphila]EOS96393.1 pyridoxal phosphate (PLP) phosphatase [Erwinia tracheiphila PSU-1]KKF35081.1 pyridoxal phosphate phosphatase [Erwinia tracheiphila]UIA85013.1 pyridoxal phosphatase [Erwinia tracheiphila]UIA86743.1 pyridoxal phosphatase [Erwinia tracheiphila]
MSYRIIALDLDGTLLTPRKTILPESLIALQKAREAGVKVIIVTGRHHVAIHPFYQALALDTPAICCNGTYLYDYHAKRVLKSDPLPNAQAQQVIQLLDEAGIHGLLYVDNAMLWQTETVHVTRTIQWGLSLPEQQRPLFTKVDSLAEEAERADNIWKFALSHTDTVALQRCVDSIQARLGLACEWSWQDQVDIAKSGNSKGKRLAEWVAAEGLQMSDVLAFGDNYNDLSMLETAGLGVAMGNADDAIKIRAGRVIGSNLEPGIAETIYHEVL